MKILAAFILLSSALLIACDSTNQKLTLYYTVENTADVPVALLRLGTPFLLGPQVIQVSYNGEELPYRGHQKYYKWSAIRTESYYYLQPGEKIEVEFDLLDHFEFLEPGEYEVNITLPWQTSAKDYYLEEIKPILELNDQEVFLQGAERTISSSLSEHPSGGTTFKKPGENAQLSDFAMLEPSRITIQVGESQVKKFFREKTGFQPEESGSLKPIFVNFPNITMEQIVNKAHQIGIDYAQKVLDHLQTEKKGELYKLLFDNTLQDIFYKEVVATAQQTLDRMKNTAPKYYYENDPICAQAICDDYSISAGVPTNANYVCICKNFIDESSSIMGFTGSGSIDYHEVIHLVRPGYIDYTYEKGQCMKFAKESPLKAVRAPACYQHLATQLPSLIRISRLDGAMCNPNEHSGGLFTDPKLWCPDENEDFALTLKCNGAFPQCDSLDTYQSPKYPNQSLGLSWWLDRVQVESSSEKTKWRFWYQGSGIFALTHQETNIKFNTVCMDGEGGWLRSYEDINRKLQLKSECQFQVHVNGFPGGFAVAYSYFGNGEIMGRKSNNQLVCDDDYDPVIFMRYGMPEKFVLNFDKKLLATDTEVLPLVEFNPKKNNFWWSYYYPKGIRNGQVFIKVQGKDEYVSVRDLKNPLVIKKSKADLAWAFYFWELGDEFQYPEQIDS